MAPKAVGTGGLHGFQHRPHALAQFQVGVPDNGSGGPGWSMVPCGAIVGDGLDILDLAHGLHLVGAVQSVFAANLDEHG